MPPVVRSSSVDKRFGSTIPQFQSSDQAVSRSGAVYQTGGSQRRLVTEFQAGSATPPPRQVPIAPSEQILQRPFQTLTPGSSVPPLPQLHPGSAGHTFEPALAPMPSHLEPKSIYTSPYDSNGVTSYPAQHPGQIREPAQCTDCFDGYYDSVSSWGWSILPRDLLYKSYLGGPREPRLGQGILYLEGTGAIWSLEAGGRAGLIRYGSGPGERPEGWQLDIWGAAFPRLNFNNNLDLDAADFKVGVPLTWSQGPYQAKFEWNHISSHAGDEFLLSHPTFVRIDYLRDSFVLGGGYFVTPDMRLYGDVEYAYNTNGGSKPWHFQFGFDYSPVATSPYQPIRHPQPFFAINADLREEVSYSGGLNIVTGLQWRGVDSSALFRFGFQYYQGQSLQLEFLNDFEELYGIGMWYDF